VHDLEQAARQIEVDVDGTGQVHPEQRHLRGRRYHLVPSNPQIAGGKNIDVLLGKTGGAEALGRQP
jgi:hypothetical protein